MKSKYQRRQLFILLNELLVIIFMGYEYLNSSDIGIYSIMPLSIISIMLIGAAYIQFSNVKESCVLSKFSDLLIFLSWVFILLWSSNERFFSLAMLLYVFLPYKMVSFLLMFIFQDSGYTHKKGIDTILKVSCLLTLLSMINSRTFSLMFMLYWFLSGICFIFVLLKHRHRAVFILKQERKNLVYSGAIIIAPYIIYILFFGNQPNYMGNIGLYIMVTLPLFSINGIIQKNRGELKGYVILNFKKKILLYILMLGFIISIGRLFRFSIISYFILAHCVLWFVLLYFILMYMEIKQKFFNSNSEKMEIMQNNFYMNNIIQISREEEIKKEFSNYLHDEVLQDLLSIKNMMQKADRIEVKELIVKTLNNLNGSIRKQMQEYHPTMLESLTLKQNLNNMLEMVKQTFPMKKGIIIFFSCDENLFLVEPYNFIIYRILKELVTNAFKHGECTKIWAYLSQTKGDISLIVEDDGVGLKKIDTSNFSTHKGLSSIKEQITLINGKMTMTEGEFSGLRIKIQISMKGDDSYEHFINR